MKITIDIPDRFAERHISVLAGLELVAYKEYGQDQWKVKTESCNQCGDCCGQENWAYEWDEIRQECTHLEHLGNEHRCKLGASRPLSCCIGDPMTIPQGPWGNCSIRFETI